MDHRRDLPPGLAAALRGAGYEPTTSSSVAESEGLAASEDPWALVVLNPLVVQREGVELDMLVRMQRGGPVPVIVIVADTTCLDELRGLAVSLSSFVVRPFAIEVLLHHAAALARAREHVLALESRARELEGKVTNDFKTSLLSEQWFRQVMHVEFKRAQRNRDPLSLVLLDVDNFKRINDSTDYAFGDDVLRAVAMTIKSSCRETDFAARFGGDEFCVLLPQTTASEAVQTALRIRRHVAELTVRGDRHTARVTISIGIDTYDGVENSSAEELRRRANMALHEAKRRGKDQACLYADEPDDQGPE